MEAPYVLVWAEIAVQLLPLALRKKPNARPNPFAIEFKGTLQKYVDCKAMALFYSLIFSPFFKQHIQKNLRQIEQIDPQAMRLLLDYQWKDNIRELQNVLEYALVVGCGSKLSLSELPPEFRETPMPVEETTEPQALSAKEYKFLEPYQAAD